MPPFSSVQTEHDQGPFIAGRGPSRQRRMLEEGPEEAPAVTCQCTVLLLLSGVHVPPVVHTAEMTAGVEFTEINHHDQSFGMAVISIGIINR